MLNRNSLARIATKKRFKCSLIQRPAIILAILLLAAVRINAQKDFDYTIYSTKADFFDIDSSKVGLHLTLFRKIQKESNVLKIISLVNTGDAETYNIKYVGYDIQSKSFLYVLEDGMTIYVNPMETVVKVLDDKRKTKVVYW